MKNKLSFNDSKRRRMVLYCSKKITCIIKRNNAKRSRRFLLSELALFSRNKLESYKKVCENKDLCNAEMLSQDTKLLEFDHCQKSDKVPFITYADFECLIKKIGGCKNNLEISSTTKITEHIPSSFSMSAISPF